MTYYTCFLGTWEDNNVAEPISSDYDCKKVFTDAHLIADTEKKTVTVRAEKTLSDGGIKTFFFRIEPAIREDVEF